MEKSADKISTPVIPEQFKDFYFVLCNLKKSPIEKGWQNKRITFENSKLLNHLKKGGNAGILTGIEKEGRYLIVVDFDSREFQNKVISKFPETLQTSSGSEKGCLHLWFWTDEDKSFKILDKEMNTLADVLGVGKQVLISPSKHPSGSQYKIIRDSPIAFMSYSDIKSILKPFDKTEIAKTQMDKLSIGKDEDVTSSVSMKEVLDSLGIDTTKNPTSCPMHSSKGGKCFGWNDDTCHCFHCEGKWNKFSLVRDVLKLSDKEVFQWFRDKSGKTGTKTKGKKEKEVKPSETSSSTANYVFVPSNISNLRELQDVIIPNFDSIWFEVRACLSVYASMSLKNLNGCPSLTLVGSPSGEKTTALSFFYNHPMTYATDDFTPKAFVSHAANIKEEKLAEIDLLPKLVNRILVTPELAPLFESNREKLLENFAILTRVLDGEGLKRDSGVHGHRGYSGDYKFGWLGATTPIRSNIWGVMGKLGNRLFFLNMREKNRGTEDYIKMFKSRAYEEKVKICRGAVRSFLVEHFKKYPVRSFQWDTDKDDMIVFKAVIEYAQLLSRLRGTLVIYRDFERDEYQYTIPIIEEPPRAINSLLNLARGHALICNREFLNEEDLEIVKSVAFSSMPNDRAALLKLLIKHSGSLDTYTMMTELNCSDETARKTMKTLQALGIVNLQDSSFSGGRPMFHLKIKPEFSHLLK